MPYSERITPPAQMARKARLSRAADLEIYAAIQTAAGINARYVMAPMRRQFDPYHDSSGWIGRIVARLMAASQAPAAIRYPRPQRVPRSAASGSKFCAVN